MVFLKKAFLLPMADNQLWIIQHPKIWFIKFHFQSSTILGKWIKIVEANSFLKNFMCEYLNFIFNIGI